jgi:hypothetical protein
MCFEKKVVPMATVSFDKNIIIREPEAVEKLVEVLSSEDVKPVNQKLTSAEAMARGEEILRRCLSLSKNS